MFTESPNMLASLPMIAFSTTELSRKVGDVIAAALEKPVTLTQHNKPRLVIMSVEEYRRLTTTKRPETRSVGLLRDMPAELADDFVAAARAYLDADEQ
jgi:prevent-host-death family protein